MPQRKSKTKLPSSRPILRTLRARRHRPRGPRVGPIPTGPAMCTHLDVAKSSRSNLSRGIFRHHRDQHFVLPAAASGARGAMARSRVANPRFVFTASFGSDSRTTFSQYRPAPPRRMNAPFARASMCCARRRSLARSCCNSLFRFIAQPRRSATSLP